MSYGRDRTKDKRGGGGRRSLKRAEGGTTIEYFYLIFHLTYRMYVCMSYPTQIFEIGTSLSHIHIHIRVSLSLLLLLPS